MIPKIIHYCWFGKGVKPESVIRCINTWKDKCPDYKIIEWNEENFDYKRIPFTREAYYFKKYAFVSDVARLHALYTEGGIYMDTDVRLLKDFDSLLNCSSFIGLEAPFRLSTAVIGAEKGSSWVNDFKKTYQEKHFVGINRRGFFHVKPNTKLLTEFFNENFPQYSGLTILDMDFLCAKFFKTGKYNVTENTIAIHEFSGSWK